MKIMDRKDSKILIVDDMPENLQVLALTLNDEGYKVAFASSGKQALQIAKSKTPDLILLDVQMPDMNGYQTCEALKSDEQTKDIPIIFLTAKHELDDIVKGFNIGAIDYITKPFNQAELLARVSTHLQLKFYRDELIQKNLKIEKDAENLSELNKELLESEAKLKELNHTKNKFFSIISHDLRGPFAGLLGLSQLMVTEYENLSQEDFKSMTENLYASTKKLFSLVENLLIWSRSQMEKIEYKPIRESIAFAVENVLGYYSDSAEQKQITVKNYIDESVIAYFDPNLISTVLRNLVNNAIKFSYPGSEVSVDYFEFDDSFIAVKVSDKGVGMAPEDLEKVFKLETKHSTPGTGSEIGTGLGLMLCKEFIEKQGGAIWIDSKVGKGSDFIFTLPKKES
jgi:signal transduction histidine kinase